MSAIQIAYQGDDLELRQMVEWAHQVHEMMQHPGWQPFEDYIFTEIAKIHRRLHEGQFADLSEYKMWAGKAQGLEQAVKTAERLAATVEATIAARGEAETSDDEG